MKHIERYRGYYYLSEYLYTEGGTEIKLETKDTFIIHKIDGKLNKQLSVYAQNCCSPGSGFFHYRYKFKNQYIVGLLINTYLDNLCQSQKIEKDIRKQLRKERTALLRPKKPSTK